MKKIISIVFLLIGFAVVTYGQSKSMSSGKTVTTQNMTQQQPQSGPDVKTDTKIQTARSALSKGTVTGKSVTAGTPKTEDKNETKSTLSKGEELNLHDKQQQPK